MRRRPVLTPRTSGHGALADAISRDDWERASLLLLLAVAAAARALPPGTIDDLLALLSRDAAPARHDGGRRGG